MAGYFGSDMQQRLQARVEASRDFIDATPGACHAVRLMGCDDVDRLGWERIGEFLERDGVCGFRFVPVDRLGEMTVRLGALGYRLDTWDIFVAERATALAASEAILASGLPEGLMDLDMPTDPEGDDTTELQLLMSAAGVVPFSGAMLAGRLGPAITVAVGTEDGTIVAAAHGYLPHNAFSAFRDYAWGGLVAVAETQRGKGLGSYVNARMIVEVFRTLGATHVYELVSATNTPSRRMVESCGLRHEAAFTAGIAVPAEGARFTR